MHAPAYGLQPKAQGNSSLEFKKWPVSLLEEMTTWDLVVGMNVPDVVCSTSASPSSERAFWT